MSASEQSRVELALAHRNVAVLSGINLQSLELAEVDLAGIILDGCQMQDSILQDSWVGILRRSDMSRVVSDNCTIARLSRCIVRDVVLNRCKLGAYLIGNIFENALFSRVDIDEPPHNWRDRIGYNTFRNVTFVSADLRACVLSRSRFVNCRFVGVLLARAKAENTRFESCHFQACNMANSLRHAEMNGCTFVKCVDRGRDVVRAIEALRQVAKQEGHEINVQLDLRKSGCAGEYTSIRGLRHIVRLHIEHSLGGGYGKDENGAIARYYGLDDKSDMVDVIDAVACDYLDWELHKARVITDGRRDAAVERSIRDVFSVAPARWLPSA